MALIDSKQLNPRLSGSFTLSGSLDVNKGELSVSEYIKHVDDTNTYLRFTDDRLRVNVGGISYIDLNDAGSAPHDITFNDGTNDVDLVIKGSSDNPLFKTDASTNRIGTHGKGSPEVDFHIGGAELRVDGNISGSSTGTGSFGRAEITDNVSIGGDILLDEDQRIYFEEDKQTWMEANGANLVRIVTNNSQMLLLDHQTGNRAVFGNGTKVYIGSNNNALPTYELEVDGDIRATGDVLASRYVVSSSVTHLTQSFSSGSTLFGDDSSDNHRFTGSLLVTGSLNVESGRIFEQGSSVIDHATAMAIVFGG